MIIARNKTINKFAKNRWNKNFIITFSFLILYYKPESYYITSLAIKLLNASTNLAKRLFFPVTRSVLFRIHLLRSRRLFANWMTSSTSISNSDSTGDNTSNSTHGGSNDNNDGRHGQSSQWRHCRSQWYSDSYRTNRHAINWLPNRHIFYSKARTRRKNCNDTKMLIALSIYSDQNSTGTLRPKRLCCIPFDP